MGTRLASFIALLLLALCGVQVVGAQSSDRSNAARNYALLIGIDRYSKWPKERHLNRAVPDLQELRKVLVTHYGFRPGDVTGLVDGAATQAAVLRNLERLRRLQLTANDHVLVYFAGHGHEVPTARGQQAFLVPADAENSIENGKNLAGHRKQCLSAEQFAQAVFSIPAHHVLLIADCCYAGNLGRVTAAVPPIRRHNAGVRRAPGAPLIPAEKSALLAAPGRQVLTGGWESRTVRDSNSFTRALVRTLKERAVAKHYFAARDIAPTVRKAVLSASNGGQQPRLIDWGQAQGEFLFEVTQPRVIPGEPTGELGVSIQRVRALIDQGNIEAAAGEANALIQTHRENPLAWGTLAQVQTEAVEFEEAHRSWETALRLSPGWNQAKLGLVPPSRSS